MKRRLIIILLLLPVVLITLALSAFGWLWYSESGARWVWQELGERLATSQRGARLEGQVRGSLSRGLRFDDLTYSDESVTVAVDRAELDARLDLTPATAVIERLALQGVKVEVAQTEEPERDAPEPLEAVSTPIPVVVEALGIEGAVVRSGDTEVPIESVRGRASWVNGAVSLEVSSIEAPLLAGNLQLDATLDPPFPFQSTVRVHRFTLPEPAKSDVPWLPESLESNWVLNGDLDRITLEGDIQWPDWLPRATVSGGVEDLRGELRWRLEVEAPEALLPEEWQGQVAEAVEPGSTDPLAVQSLNVAASGGKEQYAFKGTADLRSPWTRTASVAFEGAGEGAELARWSVEGEAEVAAANWPAAVVDFTAGGEGEMYSASVDAPDLFGGSLAVSAETRPGEGQPWQAELIAREVATAPILETFAPHLDPEGASRLEAFNDTVSAEAVDAHIVAQGLLEPLHVSAQIEQLEGRIRGRDVSASGGLEFTEEEFSATNLVLQSGASQLVLNGSLGPPGLRAQVNAASLGDFLPGAGGTLAGEVFYQHDPARGLPGSRLRANLQGENLQAFDWSVENLVVSDLQGDVPVHPAVAAMPEDAPLAVSLEARSIDGPLGPISGVSATLAGDIRRHALAATATMPDVVFEAVVTGGATGDSLDAWAGKLEVFEIDPETGESWQLEAPAELRLAMQVTLEPSCLSPGGTTELCLDFEQERDGAQHGTLVLSSLPLEMVARLVDTPFRFTQRLDGKIRWNRAPGAEPTATAEFTVSEGTVIDPAENLELVRTGEGLLRFSLERGSLHSGAFSLPFDSGSIEVDFDVTDLLAGAESQLDGWVRVDLEDLGVLANFVPQLAQTEGRLRSDIRVAGTASDPSFDGAIELHDGRVYVVAPGLTLSEIQLRGTLVPPDENEIEIEVEGRFTAGEGQGEVHATVDLADFANPVLHAQLKGEQLTLIDIPDLRLQANPDVTAHWNGDLLTISGIVHVPTARFAPQYLPSETVSQSPDVVIVAGGPENGATPQTEPDLRIQGELIVSLGHDVVIDLDLARATMTGAALFRWSGPLIPMASGGYDLRGEVQAYGQTLEITQASVRFPNVPADNPHLLVRAERRIYGNSLINKAGVLVSGTLDRPLTEPYTVPATNADRARALLLTGSDFNYEQGVGALNVGTYVAPRLYLSYGVGLFEEGNVVTARYELGENLGIKATSGQDTTGIDISYTIER